MDFQTTLEKIDLDLNDLLKEAVILMDIREFQGMHHAWTQVSYGGNLPRTKSTRYFVIEQCPNQLDAIVGVKNG